MAWYALSVVFASVGSCVGPPKHRLEETGLWLAGQRPLIILQSFHFMIVKATVHLNCSRFVDEVVVDAYVGDGGGGGGHHKFQSKYSTYTCMCC